MLTRHLLLSEKNKLILLSGRMPDNLDRIANSTDHDQTVPLRAV